MKIGDKLICKKRMDYAGIVGDIEFGITPGQESARLNQCFTLRYAWIVPNPV
jgi:hypothetical protein